MKFLGPDVVVSKLQMDVIVVSENVFAEDTLTHAAERLLVAWPFLSLRCDLFRTGSTNRGATTINDGSFKIHKVQRRILPDLEGRKYSNGSVVYDSEVLNKLFKHHALSLHDHPRPRPRVFSVQVVIMEDATVFKFSMQRAAGDEIGLYKAASAYCEALSSNIERRPLNLNREYNVASRYAVFDQKKSKWQSVRPLLRTQQARAWFDACTSNKAFSIMMLSSKWFGAFQHKTLWQTVHFSKAAILHWRTLASNAGFQVSTFALVASWIHLNLETFAQSIDPAVPEQFAFTVGVRDFLKQTQTVAGECWNPFSIAMVPSLPRWKAAKRTKLLAGAIAIRDAKEKIRSKDYMQDWETMMKHSAGRLGQMKSAGKRVPASLLLTSWTHAPFLDLEMHTPVDQHRSPAMIQPIVGGLPSLPLPEKGSLDRQVAVV